MITKRQLKKTWRVFDLIRREVEPVIGSNHCILTTRIAIELLREEGVRAVPLPVMCLIDNPVYSRMVLQTGSEPTPEEYDAWKADGAWGMRLGHPDVPVVSGSWAGHLVPLVQGALILDLTIHQVNRPEKGIEMEPGLVKVTSDFFCGEPACVVYNGCEVEYYTMPEDTS